MCKIANALTNARILRTISSVAVGGPIGMVVYSAALKPEFLADLNG